MWEEGHPYKWRTWIRTHLPWPLIDLGFARKGRDCEAAGGRHHWYNSDEKTSGCYHCEIVRPGQLWGKKDSDANETPTIPGAESLVGWFGYWPRFHDAEVLDLKLGPSSVLRLRAFEMTAETDAAGHYKLQKHCTVSFWFSDEVEFSLASDSGAAGIILGLNFEKAGDRLKMDIRSACGTDGWITAKTWRIEFEPGAPSEPESRA